MKLAGLFFQTTPNKYAGIAVDNKTRDVVIFSGSVTALATIKMTKKIINIIGTTNGTLIGRSRSGCLKRRTMRPTAAKRIPRREEKKNNSKIVILKKN